LPPTETTTLLYLGEQAATSEARPLIERLVEGLQKELLPEGRPTNSLGKIRGTQRYRAPKVRWFGGCVGLDAPPGRSLTGSHKYELLQVRLDDKI
jgi:hypothetical protein